MHQNTAHINTKLTHVHRHAHTQQTSFIIIVQALTNYGSAVNGFATKRNLDYCCCNMLLMHILAAASFKRPTISK